MRLLYIDPGTGSMLFTILIGLIGAGIYSLRMLFVKIRFVVSGGKKVAVNQNKIPFVIFADHKRYWSVYEPICREMDRRGLDVVYMTASPDDPGLKNPYPHVKGQFIGEGNKASKVLSSAVTSYVDGNARAVSLTRNMGLGDVLELSTNKQSNYLF